MQYHAPFITADGAYHCPVGSIMAIFCFAGGVAFAVSAYVFGDLHIERLAIHLEVLLRKQKHAMKHRSLNMNILSCKFEQEILAHQPYFSH